MTRLRTPNGRKHAALSSRTCKTDRRTSSRKRKKSQSSPSLRLWILVTIGLFFTTGLVLLMFHRVASLNAFAFPFPGVSTTAPSATDANAKALVSDQIGGREVQVSTTKLRQQSTPTSKPIPTPPPPLPKSSTLSSEVSGSYQYAYAKEFGLKDIVKPWLDWEQCVESQAFEQKCHPRPATCTNVKEDILNNHGIGNALIVTYIKHATESLQEKPDCAPILKDKPHAKDAPHIYNFRLLDYVQEPNVVIPIQGDTTPNAATRDCILYSITRPREAVTAKMNEINNKFESSRHVPLVALHVRSGWSDELQRNAAAWEALGDCANDYPHDITTTPDGMSEINLKGVLLDTAHAADAVFGKQQWRLYVASDAPGARRYAQYLLKDRTPAIVWNEGLVGHNYLGGQTTNKEEKIETSISAFTDVLVMSQADLLVSLSSKFPRSSELISMCPQRAVHLPGHPRHGLAKVGGLLTQAWQYNRKQGANKQKEGADDWTPVLNDEDKKALFWEALPQGRDNPCAKADDPIRSCYCMIKGGHV